MTGIVAFNVAYSLDWFLVYFMILFYVQKTRPQTTRLRRLW